MVCQYTRLRLALSSKASGVSCWKQSWLNSYEGARPTLRGHHKFGRQHAGRHAKAACATLRRHARQHTIEGVSSLGFGNLGSFLNRVDGFAPLIH